MNYVNIKEFDCKILRFNLHYLYLHILNKAQDVIKILLNYYYHFKIKYLRDNLFLRY